MKGLVLIFCLLTVSPAFAASIEWCDGIIVLGSNQILRGKISLNQPFDLVLFKSNDSVTVFPAHKIHSVLWHDASANMNRRFVSLPQQQNSFRYQIFEVVLRGEISVLRRAKGILSNTKDHVLGFDYFLLFENEILSIKKFREKVYPHIMKSDVSLHGYVQGNKLRPGNIHDTMLIVQFFNKSRSVSPVMASH